MHAPADSAGPGVSETMEEASDRTDDDQNGRLAAWRRAPISMAIATVGGIGHLPVAPGTLGAVAAVPPALLAAESPMVVRLALLAAIVGISIPASTRAGLALQHPDSNQIVVDEFVGMWATMVWYATFSWLEVAVAFAAFRLLDVLKPPGAHWLHDRRDDGVGVIGDDLIAALWAAPILLLFRWLFV